MTWQANGKVYALHDVEVPARTHGWEVDLPHGHQMIAVYVPATYGNLSVVRRAIPVMRNTRHRSASWPCMPPINRRPSR
jgi:hypothetical protein